MPMRAEQSDPDEEQPSEYEAGSEDPLASTMSISETPVTESWSTLVLLLFADIAVSVAFWYLFLLSLGCSWRDWSMIWGGLLIIMVLWRIFFVRTAKSSDLDGLPYTCGVATVDNCQLFLVATVHISPKSPLDVEAVINQTRPDLVMIELDEERLDRMRGPPEVSDGPSIEDLQPISVWMDGGSAPPTIVHAQRAHWNAEQAGDKIVGDLFFNPANMYGLTSFGEEALDRLCLVSRGSGDTGQFAPFALKAHNAAAGGAQAVFVIDTDDRLPLGRIGGDTLAGDLRIAAKTKSCGFPPVPLLLLPKEDGERLKVSLTENGGNGHAHAEFVVVPDEYPRRTLKWRLCQACALIFSGIGILYGIIQCFAVEVGGEFLAAETVAEERGVPCVCIDVDMDRFWGRLAKCLLPTPMNIWKATRAWLAFPRCLCRSLFPPPENVDVLGGIGLHAAAFKIRTWLAFIIAGQVASFVTTHVLEFFTLGAAEAGKASGAIPKEEDSDTVQAFIMLGIEIYALPRLYEAVAASRDEAMYRGIVRRSNELRSSRMVAVVGAGHANGILRRVRERGLSL